MIMNKAIFLDRDGVIIQERGHYNYLPEHRLLVDQIIFWLNYFTQQGYKLMVITNQGGIEKGLYTESHVSDMHQWIEQVLQKHNIHIDHFYYCPHHSDKSACLCRKPGSLMLEKALYTYQVDPMLSYMIGDKETDILAAQSCQIKGIQIPPNDLSALHAFFDA